MQNKKIYLNFFNTFKEINANNILTSITKDVIDKASKAIFNKINNTPALESKCLSAKIKGQVHLKLENINPSGSVKDRGVHLRLSQLPEALHHLCAPICKTQF